MKRLIIALIAFSFMPVWLAVSAHGQMTEIFNPSTRTYMKVDVFRARQGKPARKYNRREVRLRTGEQPGTIIVDPKKKFRYLVTENRRAIRYGIGVGREGFGWSGIVNVKRKAEWPTWRPPAEMIVRERKNGRRLPAVMKGGPKNPLGARALYLFEGNKDTLYRIHGTNEPWSIGHNVSSGCIRMLNKDVEDLYSRVKLGAKVIVKG